jgi:hypothetical protein
MAVLNGILEAPDGSASGNGRHRAAGQGCDI